MSIKKDNPGERRISSIYAKTNSEYFPRKKSKTSESDDGALRSGKLLDNVVMYLNYREPDPSTKLSSTKGAKDALLTPVVDTESVIETIVTPDSFEQDLLSGTVVKEKLLNEVDSLFGNKVRWFHCVTRSTFRSLLDSIDLSFTAMNVLLSTASKSNILRQADGSIIITLVSLTLDEEKSVNMDQVSLYIRDNFVISFECLTSGNVIPENVAQLVKAAQISGRFETVIDKTAEDSMKSDEFDQSLSREFYLRTFITEFCQTHLFFNEMRIKLRRKYTKARKVDQPPSVSTAPNNPRVLSTVKSASGLTSCPLDISYFIYETIMCMLQISIPVLNIYINHQRELANDLAFTSSQSTTDSIKNKEEISVLRSGLNLISNLIERTLLCLKTNTTLLTSLLSVRPEYTTEILDDYHVIFQIVRKLQDNLEQLNIKIVNYERKKTDQIKVALSMVSVFFFPIGFVASVFGQNFPHSGLIPWMYHSISGIYIFLAVTCFILLATFIALHHKGWGDTLGELHVVGKVFIGQFSWWNQLLSTSNGVYLSKQEIDKMISSRKGTNSNKVAMHASARRYHRSTNGNGNGDRLRNFNV